MGIDCCYDDCGLSRVRGGRGLSFIREGVGGSYEYKVRIKIELRLTCAFCILTLTLNSDLYSREH